MTEKQFNWDTIDGDVIFYEDGAMMDYDDVVDLLNELNDENEQLKQQLADVDRLIDDLGHDEMRRQYEEIFKGDVE
jgi:hypothetical protein